MAYIPRKQTKRLLQALDDGEVSYETVVQAALNFLSEDEVARMVRLEELLPREDEGEFD